MTRRLTLTKAMLTRGIVTLAMLAGAAAACDCATSSPAQKPTAPSAASTPTVQNIDAMLREAWAKEGITPSPAVDDARFLRRLTLDITGNIPSAEAVLRFERDTSHDKRAKVTDELLASPAYAANWAVYWDDVLIGRDAREVRIDRAAFRGWLRDEFAANTPWNVVVYALLSATGQNSAGASRKTQAYGFGDPAMGSADAGTSDEEGGEESAINPAVNWLLKYSDAPQDLAGAASKTFLGVQIQCAQCHDHKTEKWTQNDFRSFASCFTRTRVEQIDKGNTMGNVRRVNVRDVKRALPRFVNNPELSAIAKASPAALDGVTLVKAQDPRAAIARWMTAKENPWFAPAIVNRMWAHFLGRGFVDPIDDLRPSNPPTLPAVLQALSDDFAASGYDLRHLIRTIVRTEAYQRSTAPAESGATPARSEVEHKLWARFRMTPMGPEELTSSILSATNLEAALRASNANIDNIRRDLAQKYSFLFDVDEEFDHDAFEGTIAQALSLLNGSLTGSASSAARGGALEEILEHKGDRERIDALYIRTLSRHPSEEESAYWVKYVKAEHDAPQTEPQAPGAGGDALRRLENRAARTKNRKAQAYEDVVWALLNSSEFVFKH